MDKDLKNKSAVELKKIVTDLGREKFCVDYIFSFIHAKAVVDIDKITPLAKSFRKKLIDAGFYISTLKTVKKLTDPDSTVKYLFELPDGCRVESVLLFDDSRKTLCVSTQTGCKMNCSFCATAKVKFKRNLTAAEIADQIIRILKDADKINNIVFMGMGEPLDNYENLVKAVKILKSKSGQNIGARRITISTAGLAPAITRLADEKLNTRLAISLNAPNDELRNKIMPINKTYPLKVLFKALRIWQVRTKMRITFEYILIKGLNDSPDFANKLCKLIAPFKSNVNLIEYNPHPHCKFKPSSHETIENFKQILTGHGIETAIRFKKGAKIRAACGQLTAIK